MSKSKIIILAAVLAGIFYLSNQPASQSRELSMIITEPLYSTLGKVSPAVETSIGELHTFIRKSAHFLVFLLLGFATASVVKGKGTLELRTVGIAFGLCILFAAVDETHQLFVVGRGAQVEDVFIDSLGAAIGVGIYGLINWLRNRRRQ